MKGQTPWCFPEADHPNGFPGSLGDFPTDLSAASGSIYLKEADYSSSVDMFSGYVSLTQPSSIIPLQDSTLSLL